MTCVSFGKKIERGKNERVKEALRVKVYHRTFVTFKFLIQICCAFALLCVMKIENVLRGFALNSLEYMKVALTVNLNHKVHKVIHRAPQRLISQVGQSVKNQY
jgi:hypothetical protein